MGYRAKYKVEELSIAKSTLYEYLRYRHVPIGNVQKKRQQESVPISRRRSTG